MYVVHVTKQINVKFVVNFGSYAMEKGELFPTSVLHNGRPMTGVTLMVSTNPIHRFSRPGSRPTAVCSLGLHNRSRAWPRNEGVVFWRCGRRPIYLTQAGAAVLSQFIGHK